MSRIALILFLLIIIIYVLSYLRFNIQHFQSDTLTPEQLNLALDFFNGLNYENNTFTINDKPIMSQIKGVFRLGMWKLEDYENDTHTYLNFLTNKSVLSFDTKESDNLATNIFDVNSSASTVSLNFNSKDYNFEYIKDGEYKESGSNNMLIKLETFTIKTLCSATQGNGCNKFGNEKSLFYLNDVQYNIKHTLNGTLYENFGAESNSEFYGMHVLVLNENGSLYNFNHFNTNQYADKYIEAIDFIKSIPKGKIVAINTYGDMVKLAYPRIEIFTDTASSNYRAIHILKTFEKHIDLDDPVAWSNNSDIYVADNNTTIKRVKMSPGVKITLYESIAVSNGIVDSTSSDIERISDDITSEDTNSFKIINLSASEQKNYKSFHGRYEINSFSRNAIEVLKEIGAKYHLKLNEGDSYTIIGVKGETIGSAVDTRKTPNITDNCSSGRTLFITEGLDTTVSRTFTLKAYQPVRTKLKIDVFSKGLYYTDNQYDLQGFLAFYKNDIKETRIDDSRGINMMIFDNNGNFQVFRSFDTHYKSIENAALEELLNFYETIDAGYIICIAGRDDFIYGATQFAKLYNGTNNYGRLDYFPHGEFANGGEYSSIYDDGVSYVNGDDLYLRGKVDAGQTTSSVTISPRINVELYTETGYGGEKKLLTNSTSTNEITPPQIFKSAKLVRKENKDYIDIYDVIKDIGGPDDITFTYRSDFAIIGVKGAEPNTAIYEYNPSSYVTLPDGRRMIGSPSNKIAHASREFDL